MVASRGWFPSEGADFYDLFGHSAVQFSTVQGSIEHYKRYLLGDTLRHTNTSGLSRVLQYGWNIKQTRCSQGCSTNTFVIYSFID